MIHGEHTTVDWIPHTNESLEITEQQTEMSSRAKVWCAVAVATILGLPATLESCNTRQLKDIAHAEAQVEKQEQNVQYDSGHDFLYVTRK